MSSIRWLSGLVLIVVLFHVPAKAQDGAAVGMLVQADGQVQIRRRGSQTAGRLADFVYPGDRLTVGLGRARLLFCPSSETIAVSDDSTIDITSKTIEAVRGVPVRQKEDRCPLLRLELGSEALERIGGFRARASAPIALYIGGLVSAPRPTFRWGSVAGAQAYRVSLHDESGMMIWEEVTGALSLPYPASKPPLSAASYQWQVRAEAGAKILAERSVTFEFKPSTVSLRRSSGESSLLMDAVALEIAGYHSEAAAAFREIRTAHPNDDRMIRHLAWLYWNAGLIDAANEEMKLLEARRQK